MTQYAVDLGLASMPDDASEEIEPFATSKTRWSEVVMGIFSRRWYLTRRTWVSSNNAHPLGLVETLRRGERKRSVRTPLRPVITNAGDRALAATAATLPSPA